MTDPGRRRRVVVVGLDHYHVAGWVETLELFPEQLEIVALYDPSPERARDLRPRYSDPSLAQVLPDRYRSLPVESDLGALLERHAPDVALVTLPNRDAPAAIARLGGAGVHLVVDKPAALSAAAAGAAFRAARAGGARVVVGLTRHYTPAWLAARAAIAGGALGTFIGAEAVFAASTVGVRGVDNPLFDAGLMGGGILSWLGIHELDALLWLTGDPVVEVQAMSGRIGAPGLAVEDVISVGLRFASGAIATLAESFSLAARGYRGGMALRGTAGSVELPPDGTLVTVTPDPATPFLREARQAFPEDVVPGYGAGGRAAVADLLAAIDEGRDPVVTGDDLVRALVLVDAAYRSAREGRVIRTDEIAR
ncbi:MAG: Gfo/Idh/MocA family oxidoreductase [Chloroflexota bacterium]